MTVAVRERRPRSDVDVDALEQLWLDANEARTVENKLLSDILSTAIYHDRVCQRLQYGVELALASKPVDYRAIDLVGYLRRTIIGFCIQIHDAAKRRTETLGPFAESLVDGMAVMEMSEEKLNEFMRPIFEESGIGDRYELRYQHDIYPYRG